MKRTSTSTFGVGKREGHDASTFYSRQIYQQNGEALHTAETPAVAEPTPPLAVWADRIYCQSSAALTPIPDNAVGLAFTSPPYNVGKDYDDDLPFEDYLALIEEAVSYTHLDVYKRQTILRLTWRKNTGNICIYAHIRINRL